MPDILFLSEQGDFAEDLSEQIRLYAPDFTIHREEKKDEAFDLYLLDEQPEKLKDLRCEHHKAPVILLSSEGNLAEDDNSATIIAKPFALADFLNRLRSSINLFENRSEGYLIFNVYELHPVAKEILNLRTGEVIKLTEKEVAVIKYLYKAKDKIVSKNDLLQDVWDYNPEVTTHTIETHIYRLRQKVEHDGQGAPLIMTEDGGYKLFF